MRDLTQDEATVLMITAKGESLAAIGRWEKPIEELVRDGFLHRHDKANHIITLAGKEALAHYEQAEDQAFATILNTGSVAQRQVRDSAERLAQALADIARQSQIITGDAPADAARKWSETILNRTLELLGARP